MKHGTNTNGGYLVEKDAPAYYSGEKSGFMTKSGYCFTLKSPQHASREQVEYIRDHFQAIEDMITNGVPDYNNYIDLSSFAARYLVDEISFNTDSNMTSMYFYKKQDDSFLYAGPVWDYDLTMGWGKNGNTWTMDYEKSILDPDMSSNPLKLNWFPLLYMDEIFYNHVINQYKSLLPYLELLLNSTIDEYANAIRSSVRMDTIRWQSAGDYIGGHYVDFDNNIRYLKYFLSKHLNYLCDKWQINHDEFTTEGNGQQHKVTFIYNGITIAEEFISDGNILSVFPHMNGVGNVAWYYELDDECYSDFLPIYEDCTLYASE